jgi:hypothetical protein
MPGPAPKDPKLRQRRNTAVSAVTIVDEKPLADIPELPRRRRKWRPETVVWWNDIWHSPMCGEYIKSDIHQLYILADLIDQYWRQSATKEGPSATLATEIRLQRQCFGMTPIDRRRLEWTVEKAEDANAKGRRRREDGRKLKRYKVDPRAALEAAN